ncbi:MAG: protein kinase [Acidobacteria bacterium]|nr:protein kinase [Acidobacteriota bacterium]
MTLRDQWQAVSPYLDEALSLPDEQRAAWFAALRERDPAVATVLGVFLAEYQNLGKERFLEDNPVQWAQSSLSAGQAVGPYQLLSQLGQGGMGSVWLAERKDGRFERRVAVKFLNIALSGHGGEERFKREGSILGRLEHPHIARLFDAGVHAGSQPYLVLEYVDGQWIDRYANSHSLDERQRVTLFLDVLAAVAHAHANLIVHRDLKPSNVLVGTDGQVKLLDFGIAKLLEEDDREALTLLTKDGAAPLTPQYAAPEQLTGGNVTTATDVYTLGVLLYLLLSGQHPAGPGPHSPAELMKSIVETEPPPLHRGDLDIILAKALKKDPRERYPSVTAFADDLRRYLANEPIGARADSFLYRAGKFVRRNRLAVLGVAVASLALIMTAAVAVSQAADARNRFDQVRKMAHTFLFDFYPELGKVPGNTKATALLMSTAREYLNNLAQSAGNDRSLLLELAEAYELLATTQGNAPTPNLNQRELALDNRLRALEIRIRLQDDWKSLQVMAALTDDLRNLGRLQEAREMGARATRAADQLLQANPNPSADILMEASNAHLHQARVIAEFGELELAESEIAKGERLLTAGLQGKVTRLSIVARQDRADLLVSLGRLQEAIMVLETAERENEILIQQAKPGAEHLRAYRNRQVTRASLAETYDNPLQASLDQPEKAMAYRNKLREGWEYLTGLDPNNNSAQADLAVCYSETAVTLMKLNPEEAIALARRGVALFDRLERITPDDPSILIRNARAATRLAMTLLVGHRAEEARHVIQGAVKKHRYLIAKRPRNRGYQLSLVWALTVEGRAGQARSALEEAIQLAEATPVELDLNHLRLAVEARQAYAALLTGEERCNSLRRAQELWSQWKGHSSPWVDAQRKAAAALVTTCPAGG